METPLTFEWDDAKAAATLGERQIAFADAARVFFDADAVELDVGPDNYGGRRVKVIGVVQDVTFAVVATRRDDVIRIISARRASPKERRLRHG